MTELWIYKMHDILIMDINSSIIEIHNSIIMDISIIFGNYGYPQFNYGYT